MCGRYTLRRADLASAAFTALPLPGFEEFPERGHFNVAPSQQVAVVRLNSSGDRVLGTLRWGLVPSWAGPKPKARPINARAETVSRNRMFKGAIDRRRCLVAADGFYEWQRNKARRQPFFFHLPDDGLFALAGLWERWLPPYAKRLTVSEHFDRLGAASAFATLWRFNDTGSLFNPGWYSFDRGEAWDAVAHRP